MFHQRPGQIILNALTGLSVPSYIALTSKRANKPGLLTLTTTPCPVATMKKTPEIVNVFYFFQV